MAVFILNLQSSLYYKIIVNQEDKRKQDRNKNKHT